MKDMMEIGLMIGEVPEVSPENKKRAEEFWMYGATPEELAKAWGKSAAMAKLKKCGNCEYFDNRAKTLKALDAESNQGACKKFKFLCDQDAACQGWDCKEFGWEEDDD